MSQPSVVCLNSLRSASVGIVGVRSAGVGIAGIRSAGVGRGSREARRRRASMLVYIIKDIIQCHAYNIHILIHKPHNVIYNALKDMICTLHAPVHCVYTQTSIVEQQMYTEREVTLFTKIYNLTTATSTVK